MVASRMENVVGRCSMVWHGLSRYLAAPKDPSSLAAVRILFGLLMLVDIPFERGFSEIDERFGDTRKCHFPLFDFLKPLPFAWMCLAYLTMWIGAFGIAVGYHFKLSCTGFLVPYCYVFLLDKTSWNNHSYLYGLLGILMLTSSANHYCSLDSLLGRVSSDNRVPNWNYVLLRFQVFLLYFYAGVKKIDYDWLTGNSMKNLANHWVFDPFKLLLDGDSVEFYIVHLGGFLLDLTLGFWLLWPRSRPYALLFGGSFHVMNSQLFSIGMFPYVCLATMPVFCSEDWPKKLLNRAPVALLRQLSPSSGSSNNSSQVNSADNNNDAKSTGKGGFFLIALYVTVQLVLPWTHGITQGYNNWTNGLYGYSWDMMVHGWQTMHVVVSVKHKPTSRISYLDTEAFVNNDRWVGHADMIYQYAHCVKDRLRAVNMTDIEIYVDVWRSLNGRFQQRLVDPRVDILTAEWSPLKPTKWLMPLLTELTPWRAKLEQMEKHIFNESQSSSIAFVADFPGLSMENYVPESVSSARLQILQGSVRLSFSNGTSSALRTNDTAVLPSAVMHTVRTTSQQPACYAYTYVGLNATADANKRTPHATYWTAYWSTMHKCLHLVTQSLLSIVFGTPLVYKPSA